MRHLFLFFLITIFIFPAYYANALDGEVSRITIEGNKIVSDATIVSKIKIRAGQAYNENVINEDIKNLYGTGFFEVVEVEKQEEPDGIVVIFEVKEKPVLKAINIESRERTARRKTRLFSWPGQVVFSILAQITIRTHNKLADKESRPIFFGHTHRQIDIVSGGDVSEFFCRRTRNALGHLENGWLCRVTRQGQLRETDEPGPLIRCSLDEYLKMLEISLNVTKLAL